MNPLPPAWQGKAVVLPLITISRSLDDFCLNSVQCPLILGVGPDLLKAGLFSIAALAALTLPASAQGCPALRDGPRGLVTEVTDGDTVHLDNGLIVRLVGMQAPKLALGRPGFEDWPLGDVAKAALEQLVLRKPVQLRYGGEEKDRYGRFLAQLYVVDGGSELWVQGAMVASGYARVYAYADNRACLASLLAAEGRARADRLGIWRDPYYSVLKAEQPSALADRQGQYQLVEGRVLLAEQARGRVYLNFGRNWTEDFTAVIGERALPLFAESGLDPLGLSGALVRVRGWVDDKDGPRIEVTHPEQIEVLATR